MERDNTPWLIAIIAIIVVAVGAIFFVAHNHRHQEREGGFHLNIERRQ